MSTPIVRLGIRVRADRAELALADLLPLLQAGAEERSVDGDVTTRWLDLAAGAAPWAPAVVANLTRELLLDIASLVERPPELLVASGMLSAEVDEVVAAFGLRERERRVRGEWAAVVLS